MIPFTRTGVRATKKSSLAYGSFALSHSSCEAAPRAAFRVRPSSGFGVLLTYDETVHDARSTVITDTSLATVPSGYHTIAAAAGHDLYYLWAAHGTADTYLAMHTDPAHAWLLNS